MFKDLSIKETNLTANYGVILKLTKRKKKLKIGAFHQQSYS